jgi:hypothetical protein
MTRLKLTHLPTWRPSYAVRKAGHRPRQGAVSLSFMRVCFLGLAAQIAVSASAATQSTPAAPSQVPPPLERRREIALALSSCPASLASQAAVYLLGASGYVKVRDSQNGFTAIVQHALPTSQEPQCMDAEGARTFLPRMLKVAELRAQGRTGEEIQSAVADAVAKGVFPAPQRPGVIYMLSTQNVLPSSNGVVGAFAPHVMFFGTHLTNADLGVDGKDVGPDGNPNGPTFVAGENSPYALIIVPVGSHTGPDHTPGVKRPDGPQ